MMFSPRNLELWGMKIGKFTAN